MLHTVNKSPADKPSLHSCLRFAAQGSDVLLIEDGVYAALVGNQTESLIVEASGRVSFYALEPDLRCRGFGDEDVIDEVTLVDYAGFVDLAVRNPSVHAWL